MAMLPLPGSTKKMGAIAVRAMIFGVFLWGTAVVLAGHSILLHPLRRVRPLFQQGLHLSGASDEVIVTGYDELVGNSSRFVLDSTWDIHAPPTTRVYNWSVFFSSCILQ